MRERSFSLQRIDPATGTPFELACLEVRSDEEGLGEGSTAIVLHGGPGASMDYLRPQLDYLISPSRGGLASPTRRLVYYDQRGGGRSLPPNAVAPAGIAEHLDDLRAVIAAHTTSSQRPSLVGYSWGGLLALHLALDEPASIERLLLIAPAPAYAEARALMQARMRAAAERPEARAFVATLDRSDRRQRFAGAVVGYFYEPKRALELTPFMSRERAERAVWDSLAGYDLRPRLPSLAVPTLICHGVEDPIPIEASRVLAERSGAELVELERCGHCPYIEAAEPFFAAALPFLDGQRPTSK